METFKKRLCQNLVSKFILTAFAVSLSGFVFAQAETKRMDVNINTNGKDGFFWFTMDLGGRNSGFRAFVGCPAERQRTQKRRLRLNFRKNYIHKK